MRRLIAALTLCVTLLVPVALPVSPPPATQAQQDFKAQTIYVAPMQKKYHRDSCRYLAASKISISPKDAKANGYAACRKNQVA
jgi:hypothetical protein